MRLLLDHPAVRTAPFVRLSTRDARGFYERLGFAVAGPSRRWPSSTMILSRDETSAALRADPAE